MDNDDHTGENDDATPARRARLGSLAERAAFVLFILFIVAASIPHGLVTPAGRFGAQLFSFMLAALVALTPFGALGRPARRLTALLVVLAGIGLIQILPLPAIIIETISPASARIYHESSAILENSGREPVAMRLSIAPRRTTEAALFVLACAALVYSAAKLTRSVRRRRILAGAVVLGALLQLLYVAAVAQPGRIHGTLSVSNNLAAFLAIAFTTAAAFALAERSRSLLRAVFFVLAMITTGAGLVMTRSTGGLAAAMFSTALLLLISRAGGRLRHSWMMVATMGAPAAALAVTLLFAVKGTELLTTLAPGTLAHEALRVVMWSGALDTWKQFPLMGAGLGAFEDALRSPSIRRAVAHPHHELLHLAATAGFAGVVISLVAVISTWSALLRIAADGSWDRRAMALAAFGALCAISVHGLVDFPLAVPAIAAVLACVVGAGLGEVTNGE